MRHVGRITSWNEDKGYGFVTPHGGGARAFVHIKAFPFGSRRPVDGDLVSYSLTKDERGRSNAVDVRHAGQKSAVRRPARRIPRIALGVGFLLLVTAATILGFVPAILLFAYLLLAGLSHLLYTLDKAAAGKGRQRTPESTLHFVDLLGGWPGALIAQQQSRHKTVKASFQVVFWCTVLANVAVVAWLVRSGVAESLAEAALG
jgi:uncharacterized membrane protein YsdA (DUF1294 family)/cold shock CspA family protein